MTPSPTRSLSSALALVQGLQRFGLAVVVTSPGSRNAPLMQAFDRFGLQTVVALDERTPVGGAVRTACGALELDPAGWVPQRDGQALDPWGPVGRTPIVLVRGAKGA